MVAVTVRLFPERNISDDLVAIDGVRTELASFLTDKELANLSNTCKSFTKSLLADDLWKKRLIDTKDAALSAIASIPHQSQFFLRYAKHRDFERGTTRATHAINQFVMSSDHILIGAVIFTSAENTPLQEAKKLLRSTGFMIFSTVAASGAITYPILAILTCRPPLSSPNNCVMAVVLAPMAMSMGLPHFLILMHRWGVIQRIGGHLTLLQPRVARDLKNLLRSPPCQAVSRRVTTCWQAFGRGAQRCFTRTRNYLFSSSKLETKEKR